MTFKRRSVFLLGLYVVVLLALIGRLGFIQFVRGAELEEWAMAQWMREVPVEPKRGVVYDRNLRELAISANADTVVAIPARIDNPADTAAKLAAVLGMSEENVFERVTRKRALVYIARKITPEQAAAVRSLELQGISFQIETRRYYPHLNTASQLLGFAGIDNQGLYGIELSFDQILRGKTGEILWPTDATGQPLPGAHPEYVPPVDGNSIVLSVDEVVQHIVERELDIAMQKHNAQSALVVAMDPRTGGVLAMASRPDFDPNSFNIYPAELWRNSVVSDSFEPGSTFKVVTAAAALNEGLVHESDRFHCSGSILVAGHTLHCHRAGGHGSLTFEEVVWKSCNPSFVTVGQRLGAETLFQYIEAFGFGQKTGISLPGEATGIMFKSVGPVELATTSFGQGPAVTPLQQVAALSAVANGGTLYKPLLVLEERDSDGNVIKSYSPEATGNPITAETSARLRMILEGVVSSGSGQNAYIEGYRVAGKTGTAQVPRPGGGYYSDKHIASFIGFAPADNPQVVLLVMVNEPKGIYGYYGSQVAAPAFRAMMTDILRYLNVPADTPAPGLSEPSTITVPDLRSQSTTAALAHMREVGLNLRMEGVGSIVTAQTPLPGARVLPGTTIVVELGEIESPTGVVEIPNVVGMSMRDASLKLSSLGLRIIIEGSGIAVEQSPATGVFVERNSGVRVIFKP
jgi:stage V sporulation protein D (sporulation-specific penicillin-binding protein)